MRRLLVLALLLCALPSVVGAQVNYYSPSGRSATVSLLDAKSTAVATSGTSAEVLATYTLQGGTLSANSDAVRITAFYTTAANGNNKAGNIKLGGIAGDICAARSAADNAQKITLICYIFRTGAATQKWWGSAMTSASAPVTQGGTMTQTLANDLDIVLTATTATSAGDATFEGWLVELMKVQ